MLDTWAASIEIFEAMPKESEEGTKIEYPLNELAKQLMNNGVYTEAYALGDMTEAILQYENPQQAYAFRGAYAVCAGSFVSYLDTQYGFDKIMQLYQGGDIEEICGADWNTVINAWKQSLVQS